MNDQIWNEIIAREGKTFTDHKGKPFTYHIRKTKTGDLLSELVIDGKHKTITRATLLLAYHRAEELQEARGCVASHRKLGAFGSEYLYPVFLELGVCTAVPGDVHREPAADKDGDCNPGRETERQPVRSCKNCGYTTTEEFDFCPKCGSRLS